MKKPIQEIRRRELIEGAYRVFLEHGIAGLTTARICKEAGMSPGLLVYYFKSKDEVLFWMVRHANRVIMDEVIQRMERSSTPWERLSAIVEGNFPPNLFNRNTANAWLSFYAVAARDPQLERLQTLFHRRLSSNLRSCVHGLFDQEELARFVLGVGILIDGCWLRKGGLDVALTCDDAIGLIRDYIVGFLGPDRLDSLQKQAIDAAPLRRSA